MEKFDLYKDIEARTKGEIYIGVVGPVRTGKSTFIKRFMDLLVLPNIVDIHSRERAKDELPQSSAGRTIMTTEPKFIPKEAVNIKISEDVDFNVRMIDCVGYMVEGAVGHLENEQERLVKTPWFEYEIPFTKAAEIGTQKVINEHSTIGIVITCDGSFGDIEREKYVLAEQKTIKELKTLKKPFIVLLNSIRPYSKETIELAEKISKEQNVSVMPVNCEQLKKEDINKILQEVLLEFPVSYIEFKIPSWVETLSNEHWLKKDLIEKAKQILININSMKDIYRSEFPKAEYISKIKMDKIAMDSGKIILNLEFDEKYYYQILSDLIGIEIENEYQLINIIKDLSARKMEYEKVANALDTVVAKGYSVVTPNKSQIKLSEPEIIKHSNKFGVKIKAEAPSIHMIKANIATEIAPIVGSETQAVDLINYIKEGSSDEPDRIWQVNIFGKTLEELVEEGLKAKSEKMDDNSQLKLQESMEKIINDSNGGLVCIII